MGSDSIKHELNAKYAMDTYDKAMELTLNESTMALFTPKELRITGRVLMVQALIKEGYTVDRATEYQVNIASGALQIRAYRGNVQ